MTTAALTFGCAFLAFGPFASLFFLIAYQKAQLIIVVTTAAFSYLLSTLISSLLWLPFNVLGLDGAASLLIPGIFAQFVMRCAFVKLYHKVEGVIQISIEHHERTHPTEQDETTAGETSSSSGGQQPLSETARLRLELNDWVSGVAAGTGFAGMHAIMLYGTLLASEGGNVGTLYQDSCPAVPSVVLSAITAFFFSIADVIWMLLTFFGMRRRRMYPANDDTRPLFISKSWGALLENSRFGGNMALLATLVSHMAATLVTTFNMVENGCVLSLPLLGVVVVLTVLFFWGGLSRIYLPDTAQRPVSDSEMTERHGHAD